MSKKYWRLMPEADRRGFIALALVLLIGCGVTYYFLKPNISSEMLSSKDSLSVLSFQMEQDSVEGQYRERYTQYNGGVVKQTFPFDPNACDSVTFVRLGLKPWMAHNALKYRRKGGRWRSPEDFKRLYGLTKADFERLKPYIRIDSEDKSFSDSRRRYDSIRASYPQKYKELTIMDLNAADTTQLKRIPGVGSYYASKICRYRERLGGFVSRNQIKEVDGLPEDIEKWFEVSPNASVKTLNINKSTFKQLIHHPYLNYEQVKEIMNYIRKFGPIKSWRDLSLSEHFTPEDFKRLQPYIVF
ncbi:hypothetical protein HMPREF9332_01997 [Alloprevotella rava F0323]|uniref:Helix-hairpin-helix domain-containing protein n=1 Tax=Alloprevotella rava F0323 TaxID=679199 RepID=G5GEJ5_9BACT|nr:helix-hairpin-helix domain-containing protein [Alloprevotella rava]EHG20740.1 hypothetical protein HMPREF9332_01997 [Alloprevotella rava F0323]